MHKETIRSLFVSTAFATLREDQFRARPKRETLVPAVWRQGLVQAAADDFQQFGRSIGLG